MKTCEFCSLDFKPARREQRFCSRQCAQQRSWSKAGVCKRCQIEYVKPSKNSLFCNSSCAASFNNLSRRRTPRQCRCGRAMAAGSRQCRECYRNEDELTQAWLRDEISGTTEYALRAFVRKYIVERDGGRCVECAFAGVNPYSKRSILQIDHVDGNWQNDRPENLRLICPNCHAMTSTYGALNMGNGRKWKKQYRQYG